MNIQLPLIWETLQLALAATILSVLVAGALAFLAANKHVALVCHAPGVLRHVKTPAGKPLVEGKKVTGFTNSEEEAVGLTNVVPFLVEDELIAKGGVYSKGADWSSYVVTDGLLITGQNPTSSAATAAELIKHLA